MLMLLRLNLASNRNEERFPGTFKYINRQCVEVVRINTRTHARADVSLFKYQDLKTVNSRFYLATARIDRRHHRTTMYSSGLAERQLLLLCNSVILNELLEIQKTQQSLFLQVRYCTRRPLVLKLETEYWRFFEFRKLYSNLSSIF